MLSPVVRQWLAGSTYSGLEPVHELDDMGVLQRLKHSELFVDHVLVSLDVLLEDNLDGNPPRGALGLAHDAIGPSAEGSSELVLGSMRRNPMSVPRIRGSLASGFEQGRTSCHNCRAGRPAG